MGQRTGLVASYGLNTFVVKYPRSVAVDYPDHIKHITFFGRLLSDSLMVNLNISFTHDDQVTTASFRIACFVAVIELHDDLCAYSLVDTLAHST